MAERKTSPGLKERTGAGLRLAGMGGLIAVVALAAVDPGATPEASATGAAEVGMRNPTHFTTTFAPYPGTEPRPIGMLRANGNDVEMHYFRTGDSQGQVLEHFAEQFGRRGVHVDRQQRDGLGSVSFYDADFGNLVSVSTLSQPGGATLAIPSVVHVPEGMMPTATAPEFLPAPAGVVTLAHIEDLNPGRAGGSVSVSQLAPGEPVMLAAYYREEMDRRGWVDSGSRNQNGVQFLSFSNGGEDASVTISPIDPSVDQPESLILIVVEKKR